ncbi:MAG: ROK family protein [Pyrinomonadaceae bacterium]
MSSSVPAGPSKFVGIDASVSDLNAVCLDNDGRPVTRRRKPVSSTGDSVAELIAFIHELKQDLGEFERAGIAIPGLIDRETRRVAVSTYIPSHSTTDIGREIEFATGVAAILENDANAAAYGEYVLGAGRGSQSMFYATFGTGVGGALIVDGKIWHGASGYAGEFGSVAVNADGLRLEDVASAGNIVRRTRSRFHQDSTSSLNRLDESAITVDDIIEAAAGEDDFATMMMERTGTYIGVAISTVINLLNVPVIVLGGRTMRAGGALLDSIVNTAREFSFRPAFQATRIVVGELGDDAAAIGAALLTR